MGGQNYLVVSGSIQRLPTVSPTNRLGHSGTPIAEKDYAHFSPSYVATTIRANKPSFGFEKSTPVPQRLGRKTK
jgi:hypothetical protein